MDVGKLLTAKNFTIVVKRLLNFITSRGVTFLEKKARIEPRRKLCRVSSISNLYFIPLKRTQTYDK